MAYNAQQVLVPCQDGSTVSLDHLPDDAQGVLSLLESEGVPLAYWYDVARAYLAQGRTQQFLEVLQSSLDDELLRDVESFFKRRPTFEIVQLTCGYAAYYIERARLEPDKAARQQHLADAAARVAAARSWRRAPLMASRSSARCLVTNSPSCMRARMSSASQAQPTHSAR